MKRYPKDPTESEEKPHPPNWFVKEVMETLGLNKNEIILHKEKPHRHNFVFGGRRRPSKLGVDGNPSVDPLVAAEAGAQR